MHTAYKMDLAQEFLQPDINRPVRYLYDHYFEDAAMEIRMRDGSDEDAADMFQEAVLILIDKIKTGKFRHESSIKTFLVGIARNLWLFEKRTRERRSSREMQFTISEGKYADAEDVDISNRVFSKSNTDVMQTVFKQVGDVCSRILIGFYYENVSMKDLLQRFHFDNEQVLRNRKMRCMKKLKKLLTEQPELLQRLKILSLYEQ
jgi:RNA polymerase sigma factor (sigma-70 family)